jgi:hypothetical protein
VVVGIVNLAIKLSKLNIGANEFKVLTTMFEGDPKMAQGPRVKLYVMSEYADWEDYSVGNLSFRSEFNA